MAPTSRRGKATKPLRTRYKRKLAEPSTIQKASSSTISSDNLPRSRDSISNESVVSLLELLVRARPRKLDGSGYRRSIHALRHRRNKGFSPIAH
ncbi:hypothetical protein F3Y22_tig00110418pilonHSYRG00107 [Hibiscus syriacus]|uniref:Uncharacterized protein n=1 Tax=Hibiscus syriacus TaxID=106335 RepID=A0A6A3AP13_HIBSY|nr:hypothetical protein F3Y22_tig00110418pilonHSYRG00107 [Hibiscus syriacus]